MTRSRWYSPQLSQQPVARLYHRAKAERIPMTVLANRFIERTLDSDQSKSVRIAKRNSAEIAASSKVQ
jgi:hypothetical protein